MVNYQLGKIYKIVGNGLTYYGSTCEPTLARRLTSHVAHYRQNKKGKCSKVCSSDIIELGEYSIVLVEQYACDTKDQLHARERFFIENNECINKVIPGRTAREYRGAHKESAKEYRNIHKEYAKEQSKIYRNIHKEYIKEQARIYSDTHKEYIKEKNKIYYDTHKEHMNARQSEKFICKCGGKYTHGHKSRHLTAKKHLDYIAQELATVL
jgi:hypothetical protein